MCACVYDARTPRTRPEVGAGFAHRFGLDMAPCTTKILISVNSEVTTKKMMVECR
jgi:hypothetical protein